MNNKRTISTATLFNILKGNKPFFLLGAIFTSLSIFVMAPLLIIITTLTKSPYENYDIKAIEKNGVEMTAIVAGVNVLYNTTVNGEHPMVISYLYDVDGHPYSDQFKTLMHYNDAPIKLKDTIKIKMYHQQSIIMGMAPFSFPSYIFLIIPAVFLLVGLPFLLLGLIPALRNIKLYKYGIIKEATITSLKQNLPSGKNKYKPSVSVGYYFTGIMGQKIVGKSYSFDMTGLKVGDKVKIYVSEEDEAKNCLVAIGEA